MAGYILDRPHMVAYRWPLVSLFFASQLLPPPHQEWSQVHTYGCPKHKSYAQALVTSAHPSLLANRCL